MGEWGKVKESRGSDIFWGKEETYSQMRLTYGPKEEGGRVGYKYLYGLRSSVHGQFQFCLGVRMSTLRKVSKLLIGGI